MIDMVAIDTVMNETADEAQSKFLSLVFSSFFCYYFLIRFLTPFFTALSVVLLFSL